MQESVDLAVDPSSPDAPVEEDFFKQGIASEIHGRDEHPPVDDWSKRSRRLRIAASSAIGTVGLVAVGLLIWGGPSQAPATVVVVPPAAAAPAPVEAPPQAAQAPAAPVVAAPAPAATVAAAPAPAAAVAPAAAPSPPPATAAATAQAPAGPVAAAQAAPDTAALEETCRTAVSQKRAKDVLESCGRAFEAHPTAELAVLVAESELDRGRAASALTWARKAVAADPGTADAYVFIGTAEQQAGHNPAARDAYLKYLELAPTGRFAQDLKAVVATLK